MSIEIIKTSKSTLLLPKVNQTLSDQLADNWFEIEFWQQQLSQTGQSRGRNITWFVKYQEKEWVLRHYYRGGLIARYLKDQYLFSCLQKTRCYQELMLLEQMYQQGLPVPKPIAARVKRSGLYYRADLLMEKIPQAIDLVQYLTEKSMPEPVWHQLGALIAQFHQAGIDHSDLNAHNILIDKQANLWLIDFDRCTHKKVNQSWQQANLARLKRSFEKETHLHQTFYFERKQWQWLVHGYEA